VKTIRRYFNNADAEFARSLLVSVGIEATLAEENANVMSPGLAPGGVRLQVADENAERATAILNDGHEEFAPLPDDFVPPEEAPDEGEAVPPRLESNGKMGELISVGLFALASMGVVYVLYLLFAPLSWTHSLNELIRMGNASADKKDYLHALKYYNAALIVDPRSCTALYDRGRVFFEEKDYEKAIEDITEVINLTEPFGHKSLQAQNYTMRGICYMRTNKNDQAKDDFSKAVNLDPRSKVAFYDRAHIFFGEKDYEKAIADLTEVIKLTESLDLKSQQTQSYRMRGICYRRMKKNDMALDDFNKAINLDPKNYKTYFGRALVYSQMGDAGGVIQDCNRIIELAPGDAEGYNDLAWLYATWPKDGVRDGEKALELATKACTLSEWKKWYCIGTLAAAEAETGKFDDALTHQQQALAMAKADKSVDAKMLDQLAEALADYQQKKPYRDLKK